MNALIENKRPAICSLCQRYRVERLELFGSGTRPDFDPRSSDLDFLVEFSVPLLEEAADRYFGLLEGLEALFQCPVDLVTLRSIRNPYFLKAIRPSRVLLYEAGKQKATV
ncbi:MAG: nucleotidyltransferase domain-containing protein [Candidatus Hydrogenedentes bacterium]|nr:nucleotidyltransferase domain-containing protein [Candidatus Hydrogenedentota bacterium]